MEREWSLPPLQRRTMVSSRPFCASHQRNLRPSGHNHQEAMVTPEQVKAIKSNLRNKRQESNPKSLSTESKIVTPESAKVSGRKKVHGTKRKAPPSSTQTKTKKKTKSQSAVANDPKKKAKDPRAAMKKAPPSSTQVATAKKDTKCPSDVFKEPRKRAKDPNAWKNERGDQTKFEKVVGNQMHFWCPFHNGWKTHQVHECAFGKMTFGNDIWKKIRGDPMKSCKCVNGKTYFWCPSHHEWVEHKLHECPLHLKQQEEDEKALFQNW